MNMYSFTNQYVVLIALVMWLDININIWVVIDFNIKYSKSKSLTGYYE